jgi:hypothetical protein
MLRGMIRNHFSGEPPRTARVRARRSSPPEGDGEEDRAGGESVDSQGRTPGVRKAVGTRPRAGSSGDFATLGGKARIGDDIERREDTPPLHLAGGAARPALGCLAVGHFRPRRRTGVHLAFVPPWLRAGTPDGPTWAPCGRSPRCRDRRRIRVRATRTSWPRPPSRLGVEGSPSSPNMGPFSGLRNDLRQSNVCIRMPLPLPPPRSLRPSLFSFPVPVRLRLRLRAFIPSPLSGRFSRRVRGGREGEVRRGGGRRRRRVCGGREGGEGGGCRGGGRGGSYGSVD